MPALVVYNEPKKKSQHKVGPVYNLRCDISKQTISILSAKRSGKRLDAQRYMDIGHPDGNVWIFTVNIKNVTSAIPAVLFTQMPTLPIILAYRQSTMTFHIRILYTGDI